MSRQPLLHDVTGTGDPIVLVPGGISGWLSWIPHAGRLSTSRKVIRVQLRSVELAEAGQPYPESYGIFTEVEALRRTVEELGLESFDLAGWSHGGLVAIAFALEYPARVRTLTVIEPAAPWILQVAGRMPDELALIEARDRSTSGKDINIDDLKEFLVRAGFGGAGTNFESMPGWPVWVRNRQVLSVAATVWDYSNSLDSLRRLDIPVLGVHGSDTTVDMIETVRELVSNIPQGMLLELPGGHGCHVENIDRFLEELNRHIGRRAIVTH